jgi:uncharacterized membrane protein
MENQTPVANVSKPNTAAALSYVLGLITGLYFYLTNKDKYVRFHAMQSIVLSIVLMVISYIIGYLPGIGYMLSPLVNLAALALVIFLIIKAYHGEKFKVPVIGDFAEKQA